VRTKHIVFLQPSMEFYGPAEDEYFKKNSKNILLKKLA
jgi:hypothetical protein